MAPKCEHPLIAHSTVCNGCSLAARNYIQAKSRGYTPLQVFHKHTREQCEAVKIEHLAQHELFPCYELVMYITGISGQVSHTAATVSFGNIHHWAA